ncbi:RNA 2',3'-cyclic phosphodiesterase [Cohnella yongneupensis]|uniref:RNA 2',3'-cyclic phosphodiesterase n=1 Tax=Cohnella yongneupensis TaxID=425006 RepID=A0ABW0QYS4_9BACL
MKFRTKVVGTLENFRLFLGLQLSEQAKAYLSCKMSEMAKALSFRSWTHPADLHVTLHFIGDTPASRVEELSAAAAEAASQAAPFTLALTEAGTFGPPSAPRVLWCGLAEPAAAPEGALAALHAALGARLNASGFATEARPFRAHATLARGWSGAAGAEGDPAAAIAAAWHAAPCHAPQAQRVWTADAVTLFLTHLGRRPSYEPIGSFPFRDYDTPHP